MSHLIRCRTKNIVILKRKQGILKGIDVFYPPNNFYRQFKTRDLDLQERFPTYIFTKNSFAITNEQLKETTITSLPLPDLSNPSTNNLPSTPRLRTPEKFQFTPIYFPPSPINSPTIFNTLPPTPTIKGIKSTNRKLNFDDDDDVLDINNDICLEQLFG